MSIISRNVTIKPTYIESITIRLSFNGDMIIQSHNYCLLDINGYPISSTVMTIKGIAIYPQDTILN